MNARLGNRLSSGVAGNSGEFYSLAHYLEHKHFHSFKLARTI
jgi:hypothetical protein